MAQLFPKQSTQSVNNQSGSRLYRALNIGFVLLAILFTAITAWPIYQSAWFLLAVGGSVSAALLIYFLVPRRWAGFWPLLSVGLASYLVLAPLLGYPRIFSEPESLLGNWRSAITSGVTAWKGIVTLVLPLGSYSGMLVPVVILYFFGTLFALYFALSPGRRHFAAAVLLLGLQLIITLLGPSQLRGVLTLFGFEIQGIREIALSFGLVLVLLAWLVWRNIYSRKQALGRGQGGSTRNPANTAGQKPLAGRVRGIAPEKSPVRVTSGHRFGLNRAITAVLMLVLALAAGLFLSPNAQNVKAREVLRTQIDPVVELQRELSPLINYRSSFSKDWGTELFRISSSDPLPERLRIAVLQHYDGNLFRAMDPENSQSAFRRLPYRLSPNTPGTEQQFEVQLSDYQHNWLPLVGELIELEFLGPDRVQLADGFYYDAESASGIELNESGFSAGDGYRFRSLIPEQSADLLGLTPIEAGSLNSAGTVPSTLRDWLLAQDLPRNGAGFVEAVDRLRER
ncbi:MAG: transglutaminaseTgpA domain-containing protein, partial [Microbacteriaceae bacterium]